MADRKEQYKHKPETVRNLRLRKRSEENAIRKQKREKIVSSRRVRLDSISNQAEYDFTEEDVQDAVKELQKKSTKKMEQLTLLRRAFSQGVLFIEAFLSAENAMQCLIGILTGADAEAQLEAAWCLTNIAAGLDEHAALVLDQAGPYLVTYLSSSNSALQDQCSWAIGNIAGDDQEYRTKLAAQGAIIPLINLFKSEALNVVQSAAFALSNIARGGVEFTSVMIENGILPLLKPHLRVSDEKKQLNVLSEIAWVVTYLSARGLHEDDIINGGIFDKVCDVLITMCEKQPDNFQVLTPLLRSLGNMCAGGEVVCQKASDKEQLIDAVGRLLHSSHHHIKKESLWVLSNLTADSAFCTKVVRNELILSIIGMMSDAFDIKKEAAYCLCNIASHSEALCQQLLENGALQAMLPLLKTSDVEIVKLALGFSEMMLRNTATGTKVFEENGGLSGLELYEYHSNEELREQTNWILDKYFYKEDLLSRSPVNDVDMNIAEKD